MSETIKERKLEILIGLFLLGGIVAWLIIPTSFQDTTIILESGDGGAPVSCLPSGGLVLAQNLTDLCDVTIISPMTNQIIEYNGSQWVNIDNTSCSNLNCLSDVLIVDLQHNNLLQYNASLSQWVNTGKIYNVTMQWNNAVNNYTLSNDGSQIILFGESGSHFVINGGSNFADLQLVGNGNSLEFYSTVDNFEFDVNGEIFAFPVTGGVFLTTSSVLNDFSDVVISSVQNNQYLKYDSGSGTWKNISIVAGSGISISHNSTSTTITNTAQDNTVCANVGSGSQIYKDGECNFRTVLGSSDISVTQQTNTITIDYNGSAVTSVTATSPIVSSGGTTPIISCPTCLQDWTLLANVTAPNANTTLSTGTITGFKYIRIDLTIQSQTSSSVWGFRFNSDSGNNYATRVSDNGGADTTTSAQAQATLTSSVSANEFAFWQIDCIDFTARTKLCEHQGFTTGNDRHEGGFTWANTSAMITNVTLVRVSGTGTMTTSSTMQVWGHN